MRENATKINNNGKKREKTREREGKQTKNREREKARESQNKTFRAARENEIK